MATLNTNFPTLLDLAKRMDPDGKIANVVEILNLTNEVLEDMVWSEGNLPTGNKTTTRTGIPAPTWRKLYGGVQPNKSTTVQVTDTCGMLEAYAEVDKALADLNGNTGEFRLSEDRPHIEGMNQEIATNLFFGNEGIAPEKFTGLAPRFNSKSAQNAENIVDAGGTGSTNYSMWVVVWGPNTVHGIVPKGSKAGLQVNDHGEVTVEAAPDGSGGRYQAYRTHYKWDAGLTVRDWRYIVRVANIDRTLLKNDLSTGANLADLLVQALEQVPNMAMGQPVIYVNRPIRAMFRRQAINQIKNSTLTIEGLNGKRFLAFDGIPVRRVDALNADELRVV